MSTRATSAAPAAIPGAPVPRRPPAPIEVPREVCTLYPRASRLEWLLTNGTGGFAMGTVAGSNTRRYHGLLVASLHPPVARVVTLARLEETALTPQGAVPLSVNQYPNTLYPDGYRRLVRFSLEEGPVWTWSVDGAQVERRVLLVPGQQTVLSCAMRAPLRCGCVSSRCSPSATTTRSPIATRTPGPATRSARWGTTGRFASSRTRTSRRCASPSGWDLLRSADVARERRVPRGAGPGARLPGRPPAPRQLRAGARPRKAGARGGDGRDGSLARYVLDALGGRAVIFSTRAAARRRPRRCASPAGASGRCLPGSARGRLGHRHRRLPLVHRLGPGHDDRPRPGCSSRADASSSRARCWRASSLTSTVAWSPTGFPTRRGLPSTTPWTRRLFMFQAVHALGAGRWLVRVRP